MYCSNSKKNRILPMRRRPTGGDDGGGTIDRCPIGALDRIAAFFSRRDLHSAIGCVCARWRRPWLDRLQLADLARDAAADKQRCDLRCRINDVNRRAGRGGRTLNVATPIAWLRSAAHRAAWAADAAMMYDIALVLDKWLAPGSDEVAAIAESSARLGCHRAQRNYATLVRRDRTEKDALPWYRMAAMHPDADPSDWCAYAVTVCEHGDKSDIAGTETIEFLRRAAESGYAEAQYYYGATLEARRVTALVRALVSNSIVAPSTGVAGDASVVDILSHKGHGYGDGDGDGDDNEAMQWMERGATQCVNAAIAMAIKMHVSDFERVERLLKLHADAGRSAAYYYLGEIYYRTATARRCYATACDWFERAALHGEVDPLAVRDHATGDIYAAVDDCRYVARYDASGTVCLATLCRSRPGLGDFSTMRIGVALEQLVPSPNDADGALLAALDPILTRPSPSSSPSRPWPSVLCKIVEQYARRPPSAATAVLLTQIALPFRDGARRTDRIPLS